MKEAAGAQGVNILTNAGKAAGQEVFHVHFHCIPRVEGDNLLKAPASAKSMIEKGGWEDLFFILPLKVPSSMYVCCMVYCVPSPGAKTDDALAMVAAIQAKLS